VSELLALCADLPVEAVPPGQTLIVEGDAPGPMYVLRTGSVSVERDGVPVARIHASGAVLGEMSVVLERPATATVRAEQEVTVHVVEDPHDFLSANPGAALAVLRTTAARLDGMTQYLVDVKQQYAGLGGHLAMVDQILDALVHHQPSTARTGSVRDPEVG